MAKIKEVFKEKFTCPHCGKRIIAKKTKEVISEAVAAEYEIKVTAEKDSQTTLKQDLKEKRKKK